MLNAFIDAHEGRHVATVDIKGVFLKAKVPDHLDLIVKMSGKLMNLMCEIDLSLRSEDQSVMYLTCKKALYGHFEAARLFYNDLNNTLKKKIEF
jgi:hypothetical protein